MPGSMLALVSKSQGRASKYDLDSRIKGFKKLCSQEGDMSARGEYLKNCFTADEMKSLWSRLKTMKARAAAEAQNAWQNIEERGQREGKQAEKENYLAAAICEPERRQQIVVSRSYALTRTDSRG